MDVRFVTDTGVVVPAVTTDEMLEVDRIAIEETGPNLFQMMENAGRSLAMTAIEMLGTHWRTGRFVVLAGTGGNGGGGIAAARHLANRGVSVAVVVTDPERLTAVPEAQFALLSHTSARIVGGPGEVGEPDLTIDAVIGYSLRSAPRGAAADLIAAAGAWEAPVLALDVPSGVDATTGATPGDAITATVTVTLALPKTGLVGPDIGRLLVADIGIPDEVYARIGKPLVAPIFDDRWVVPVGLA